MSAIAQVTNISYKYDHSYCVLCIHFSHPSITLWSLTLRSTTLACLNQYFDSYEALIELTCNTIQ